MQPKSDLTTPRCYQEEIARRGLTERCVDILTKTQDVKIGHTFRGVASSQEGTAQVRFALAATTLRTTIGYVERIVRHWYQETGGSISFSVDNSLGKSVLLGEMDEKGSYRIARADRKPRKPKS